MPIVRPKKRVILTKGCNEVLTILETVFTELKISKSDSAISSSVQTSGKAPVSNSLINDLKLLIERKTNTLLGAEHVELAKYEVQMDSGSENLFTTYQDYWTNLMRGEERLAAEKVTKNTISDPRILIREVYLRLIMSALSADILLDPGQDRQIFIRILQLLTVKLSQKEQLSPVLQQVLFSEHGQWLNELVTILDQLDSMNKRKTVLRNNLRYLDLLKNKIKRYLVLNLAEIKGDQRSVWHDRLSGENLNFTLSTYEKNFLLGDSSKTQIPKIVGSEEKNQNLEMVVIDSAMTKAQDSEDDDINDIVGAKELLRQNYIIESMKQKKIKMEKIVVVGELYGLYNKAKQIYDFIHQIGDMADMVGWLPFLLGVVDLDQVDSVIEKHVSSCEETFKRSKPLDKKFSTTNLGKEFNETTHCDGTRDILQSERLGELQRPELLEKVFGCLTFSYERLEALGALLFCPVKSNPFTQRKLNASPFSRPILHLKNLPTQGIKVEELKSEKEIEPESVEIKFSPSPPRSVSPISPPRLILSSSQPERERKPTEEEFPIVKKKPVKRSFVPTPPRSTPPVISYSQLPPYRNTSNSFDYSSNSFDYSSNPFDSLTPFDLPSSSGDYREENRENRPEKKPTLAKTSSLDCLGRGSRVTSAPSLPPPPLSLQKKRASLESLQVKRKPPSPASYSRRSEKTPDMSDAFLHRQTTLSTGQPPQTSVVPSSQLKSQSLPIVEIPFIPTPVIPTPATSSVLSGKQTSKGNKSYQRRRESNIKLTPPGGTYETQTPKKVKEALFPAKVPYIKKFVETMELSESEIKKGVEAFLTPSYFNGKTFTLFRRKIARVVEKFCLHYLESKEPEGLLFDIFPAVKTMWHQRQEEVTLLQYLCTGPRDDTRLFLFIVHMRANAETPFFLPRAKYNWLIYRLIELYCTSFYQSDYTPFFSDKDVNQAFLDEVEEGRRQIRNIKEENAKLRKNLQCSEKRIIALEEENKELKEENKGLQKEYSRVTEDLANKLNGLQKKIEEQEQKYEIMQRTTGKFNQSFFSLDGGKGSQSFVRQESVCTIL